MPKKLGVAEVRRHFPEVISKIALNGAHFIIEKKGKSIAALVSVKDLEMIESLNFEKKKGLLAAIGAWEEFDEIEEMVSAVYKARFSSRDQRPKGLF